MTALKSKLVLTPGKLIITHAAANRVPAVEVWKAVAHHAEAEWDEDFGADRSLCDSESRGVPRLISGYRSINGTEFLVITEADSLVTTVLLPEEY